MIQDPLRVDVTYHPYATRKQLHVRHEWLVIGKRADPSLYDVPLYCTSHLASREQLFVCNIFHISFWKKENQPITTAMHVCGPGNVHVPDCADINLKVWICAWEASKRVTIVPVVVWQTAFPFPFSQLSVTLGLVRLDIYMQRPWLYSPATLIRTNLDVWGALRERQRPRF